MSDKQNVEGDGNHSEFLVWRFGVPKDGVCKVDGPEGIEKAFEINDGVSRIADWPDDIVATMSPDFPKDIALADSVAGAPFVVVSGKVKTFLEEAGAKNVEYLPMKIINHKGRVASDDYFILNPLEVVDCIDQAASEVKRNSVLKEMIKRCKRLVLRKDAIPPESVVFRTKFWSGRIIIRRRVADAMVAAGLTGLHFVNPAEYTGLI